MEKIFKELNDILEKEESAILVNFLMDSKPAPRYSGAKMLINMSGEGIGSIGGGPTELAIKEKGRSLLQERSTVGCTIPLGKSETKDLGMICGGDAWVHLTYVNGLNQTVKKVCTDVLTSYESSEKSWLITDMTDDNHWQLGVTNGMNNLWGLEFKKLAPHGQKFELDGRILYSEPLVKDSVVYVCGGGHISQHLVTYLDNLNFNCVVLDNNPFFANYRVFPKAKKVLAMDFKKAFEAVEITENDYICIMSRGHEFDFLIECESLKTPAFYMGAMGGLHKIIAKKDIFAEEGFQEDELRRFCSPIGIDISAETPEEIALSIASELVYERAKKEGRLKIK